MTSTMLRSLRHPLPYLLVLLAHTWWTVMRNGWMEPRVTNDTLSYVLLLRASNLAEALSGLRTYAYPLLLKAFAFNPEGPLGDLRLLPIWGRVPELNFVLYAVAVLLFWLAVRHFARSGWLAFAAVVPLLFSPALEHVRLVVTDSPAESFGIISVSLLLLLVSHRDRVWAWLLLGLVVLFTYWLRPMYQFLVVLIPLLGAFLYSRHAPDKVVFARRLTLALAALVVVPLLLFSTVRWAAIGHFSVSSLSGYQFAGIGALFLDEELIDELPQNQRRLAREILDQRTRRGWVPLTPTTPITAPVGPWPARSIRWELTENMFPINEDAVMKILYEEWGREAEGPMDVPGMMGPTALAMDERLGELGRALIARRPLLYVKFVWAAFKIGVSILLEDRLVRLLSFLLALSIPAALIRAVRGSKLPSRRWRDRAPAFQGLLAVATVYFLGHNGAIALVSIPLDRYAVAANLLFPSALAVGLFELWRWILGVEPAAAKASKDTPEHVHADSARLDTRRVLAVLALTGGVLVVDTAFIHSGFDFDRNNRMLAEIPLYLQEPRVATGPAFFHRSGPMTWKGTIFGGGREIAIAYDQDGFRNPEGLEDWEVVVVGDSTIEQGYLPEAKLLTTRLGQRLELRVKNLAVAHTGPFTHIHYLETWGRAPSTRQAVLVFFEANLSLIDKEEAALSRLETDGVRESRTIVSQSSIVKATLGVISQAFGGAVVSRRIVVPTPQTNADLELPGGAESSRVVTFCRAPGSRHLPEQKIERMHAVIGKWGETARDLGLEPWLLYMPCKRRILHPYLRFEADAGRIGRWRPTDLPGVVERLALSQDVGFLNPIPQLSAATSRGVLVYDPLETGLSEKGSKLVARIVAGKLQESWPAAAPETE